MMPTQIARVLNMLNWVGVRGAARWTIVILLTMTILPLPCNAQYFVLTSIESGQVDFELDAAGGTYGRLFQRASKQLREAGFSRAVSGGSQSGRFGTRLVLSLRVIDLGEEGVPTFFGKACPEKKMYIHKLELWEEFVIKRNPEQQVYGGTWERSVPFPEILEEVPIERLEADLDRLIGQFIDDYKTGNPPKEKKSGNQ